MIPELYKEVVVNRDIPQQHLKKGDTGMYIDYMEDPNGGEAGAILEIFNAVGDSIRIATVPISAIEPIRPEHVPSVRLMEEGEREF
jgi:hypothetical protein